MGILEIFPRIGKHKYIYIYIVLKNIRNHHLVVVWKMILQRAIFRLPAINFWGCNVCDMKSNCDVSDNYLLQLMLFRCCTSPLSVIFCSLCLPRFQARLPLHRVPGCGRRAASPEDMRKPWVRSHQHQAGKNSATSVVFFSISLVFSVVSSLLW